MKRRKFITITTTSLGVLSVPTLYQCLGTNNELNPLIYPQTLAQIWSAETIEEIGSSYLNQVPEENDEQTLSDLISLNSLSQEDTEQKVIKSQIKKDFETENIVMVDGWILSTTEVRQCALYSLIKS